LLPAGVNVRHRAKEILQLVNSPDRLREEREKVGLALAAAPAAGSVQGLAASQQPHSVPLMSDTHTTLLRRCLLPKGQGQQVEVPRGVG
jgi:hypothetical protein